MNLRQISDLHKIRTIDDTDVPELESKMLLQGESFSYQIVIHTDLRIDVSAKITSELKQYITLHKADCVVMDYPMNPGCDPTGYLTTVPGSMPDLLTPLDTDKDHLMTFGNAIAVWVRLDVPNDWEPGNYDIEIFFDGIAYTGTGEKKISFAKALKVEIINSVVPEQKTKFTQWFHTDCIASVHNVKIYSEKHWELIDKYMALANKLGVNMLLTPVITPPLDTGFGLQRPNVQLVRMEKKGNKYSFDFTLLKRWVQLCRKNNIKYFEISHLFSQGGLGYTPNIYVYENGEGSYMFGWHVAATDPVYADFLRQFIPQLVEFLKSEGIDHRCYFHISDEPQLEHIESYRYAKGIIKPLIGNIKAFDALSDEDFYKIGIVEIPVPTITKIHEFLKLDITEKWFYYCGVHGNKVSNRFLAMPLARTRIAGLQMYKFGIDGFLQWGYNFYYSRHSRSILNPYITTSAGNAFPSGDAFTVYPGIDGPLPSMRGYVFKNALQDIEICRLLESYIGRDKVVEIIDSMAGMDVTFEDYPTDWDYIPKVMDEIKERLKELTK